MKSWRTSDIRYIQKNLLKFSDKEFAEHFGVNLNTFRVNRRRFGILRQETGRYQKGRIPENKGKKQTEYMSNEAIEKTKPTRFKKGSIPKNAKQIGDITLRQDSSGRKYKHIKTEKGWRLYHRYLWEQTNGSIPKNLILVFINKDSSDVRIENLELITRKEHVERNRNREKAAQTMKKRWNQAQAFKDYGIKPINNKLSA